MHGVRARAALARLFARFLAHDFDHVSLWQEKCVPRPLRRIMLLKSVGFTICGLRIRSDCRSSPSPRINRFWYFN